MATAKDSRLSQENALIDFKTIKAAIKRNITEKDREETSPNTPLKGY